MPLLKPIISIFLLVFTDLILHLGQFNFMLSRRSWRLISTLVPRAI